MQMEMTQRDKKLLVFLGLFVVLVGFGYWGIRPLVSNISEINENIIEQEDIRALNDLKITQLPLYEADNETLETDIVDARKRFYPYMNADEIDKLFTGKALEFNLYAYSMDIKMPEDEVESVPYIHSERAAGLVESDFEVEEEIASTNIDAIDAYANNAGESSVADEVNASTGIYAATVTMRLGGTREEIQDFIDTLSVSDEKLLVKSYMWENTTNVGFTEDGSYVLVDSEYVVISFDIYMCLD